MQNIQLSKVPNRPSKSEISAIVKRAFKENILSTPNAIFYDLDAFQEQIKLLNSAFSFAHINSLAAKANPLGTIHQVASKHGVGAECASRGEMILAEKAGYPAEKIIYYSAVKSKEDIEYALKKGFRINLDNLDEMKTVEALINQGVSYNSAGIGLRINPNVGLGKYEKTSTATEYSKFGTRIEQVEQILSQNPQFRKWFKGFHLHIGSQGCSLDMLVRGVKKVVELADYINQKSLFNLEFIDIGGGLPVKYSDDEPHIPFAEYAAALKEKVPELFKYKIITEFGRSVFTYPGWLITGVEHHKIVGEREVAMVHAGADIFVRVAYMEWYHEMLVLNSNGDIKEFKPVKQDIAGPLCFSGDYLAKERSLPPMNPGDFLVIRDCGSYTFGMWSRYNLRRFPPIFGYDKNSIRVLHPGESIEESAAFWLKNM